MFNTPPPALGKRNCCPICIQPYRETAMVECTQCRKWIHYECAKVDDEVEKDQFWKCQMCEPHALNSQQGASRALSVSTHSSRLSEAKRLQLDTIDAQLKNLEETNKLLKERQKIADSIVEEEARNDNDLGNGVLSREEVVHNFLNSLPVQHSTPDAGVSNQCSKGLQGVTNQSVGNGLSSAEVLPKPGFIGGAGPTVTTSFPTNMEQQRQRLDIPSYMDFLQRQCAPGFTAGNVTNFTNAIQGPLVSAETSSGAVATNHVNGPFDQIGYGKPSMSMAQQVPFSAHYSNYNDVRRTGAIPKGTYIPSQNFMQSNPPESNIVQVPRQPPVAQPQTSGNPSTDLNSFRRLAIRQTVAKELPAFSGKPEEWPIFISTYNYTTQEAQYTDVENMIRLSNALKGKAREVVAPMLTLPHCVPQVIETLRLYFGRPTVLIEHYINKVREMPPPKPDKLETLFEFTIAVQNLCATMQQAGQVNHMANPMLMKQLVDKLPPMFKMNWAAYKRTVPDGESLQVLSDFLRIVSTDLCDVGINLDLTQSEKSTSKIKMSNQNTSRQAKHNKELLYVHDHTKPTCISCNGNCQSVIDCSKFKNLPPREKWDVVKRNRLCNRCLKKHSGKCERSVPCKSEGCDKKYHPILHKHNETESNDTVVTNVNHHLSNSKIMFRIIPVVLFNGTKTVKTYAFLDEGSSSSLITDELCQKLQIKGVREPFCMRWTGNISTWEKESQKIDLEISGVQPGAVKMNLNQVRTVKNLNLPRQSLNYAELSGTYDYLKNLPITSYTDANPQLLIGLMNWKVAVPTKSKFDNGEGPIAIKCRLGWTICANSSASESEVRSYHICECQPEDDKNIEELVKEYFSIDSLGITNPRNTVQQMEARRAEELMVQSTSHVGDRYRTGLLWRYDNVKLPDSRPMAVQRLNCFERKLSTDPQLQQIVQEQIKDYLQKGYIRKLSDDELKKQYARVWYLPIFTVRNPNKPEKVRIVWDAKAQVNGISLNTVLLKGVDINASLLGVLLRSRERRVCICADITEMFHQVQINEQDQQVLRFLWRDCDKSKAPETYVMTVMTFGATCSPYCAQYVKNQNALKYVEQYPRAVTCIIRNHYVDDLLDSVDTPEQAIQLAKEVKFIHEKAGFNIRKWKSNCQEVVQAIEPDVVRNTKVDLNPEPNTEKVLGMWWCLDTDEYMYSMKYNKGNVDVLNGKKVPTKRELLKILMSVYDPMGLIAHYLVLLKIILQEVWKSKVNWDDPIAEKQNEKWLAWLEQLKTLTELRVPRCYLGKNSFWNDLKVQLHIFTDAGEDACACVAYLRMEKDGNVECSLVGGKTKVAPVKTRTMPRLELDAAVMGCRFGKTIVEQLSIKIDDTTFWCDSTIVLSWLRNRDKKYSKFVVFRTEEILENSVLTQWRYVPTKLNPADVGTKWVKPTEIKITDVWFSAPNFLYSDETDWPLDVVKPQGTEEECCYVVTQSEPIIDVTRFSTWKKLLNATACIYRFVTNVKMKVMARKGNDKVTISTGILTSEELLTAKTFLLQLAQQQCFAEEIYDLKKGKSVARSSPLYQLSPYVDEDNLIRIKGRIDACTSLTAEEKRPIILPRKHYVTFFVVDEVHRSLLHQCQETAINMIRSKYYIPGLRSLLKSIKRRCNTCKIRNAKPVVPEMAPLPQARLATFTKPFTHTGVDCFGPFLVAVGRRREKRWGVIFTCLTVRAIHIEVVHNMNADSFILSLRNFIARRGQPQVIYSDNGTNFVKTERLLKEDLRQLKMTEVAKEFVSPELTWRFNPPLAPNFGGCWERLIHAIKRAIYASLPTNKTPSDELLRSSLIAAESIVNSRPLTYVPVESINHEVLTPNHFLLMTAGSNKQTVLVGDNEKTLRYSYKYLEQFTNKCWKKFIQEYLPDLTLRSKWFTHTTPIKVDDIVLIVDEKSPRCHYPKGRVIEVHRGIDNQVRSAKVQTADGIYTRPTSKLAILKLENDE